MDSGRRDASLWGRHWFLGALTVPLLAVGCSGGEGAGARVEGLPLAAPPVVRDSAGITIVENSEPQWAPGSEWRVGRLVTAIGEVHGDPAYELFQVLDATRQSDGTVAVANSSTGEIRFFDRDGVFLRAAGSTGGGPGEFSRNGLRTVKRLAGDTLFAWDLLARRASVFDPEGTFVRSFSLDGPAKQHFFSGVFSDGSLLMYVLEHPSREPGQPVEEGVSRTPMTLHHYGVDHRLEGSIRNIPGTEKFRGRWGPYGSVSTETPFGRETYVSAGGNRTYVSTGDEDQISVYDPFGKLEMLIRRTLDPTPVTPEMVSRYREGRLAEERRKMEELKVDPRVLRMLEELPYPEVTPPYRRTVLDTEMNLWAEEFRIDDDGPADWLVFDRDGVWMGRVTLPQGLEVFEIGSDHILGRTKDDMEVERVLVYELVKGLS